MKEEEGEEKQTEERFVDDDEKSRNGFDARGKNFRIEWIERIGEREREEM